MKLANSRTFAPLVLAVLAVFFAAGCGRDERPAAKPSSEAAARAADAAYVDSLKRMQADQRRLAARHAELRSRLEALGSDPAQAAARAKVEQDLSAVAREAGAAAVAARRAVRARMLKQVPGRAASGAKAGGVRPAAEK